MLNFKENPPLDIINCDHCASTGRAGIGKCNKCGGKAMGFWRRGKFLYWEFPLTRYHLTLLRGRTIFNKIRRITVLILSLLIWFWAGALVYQAGALSGVVQTVATASTTTAVSFEKIPSATHTLFYLGLIGFLYIFYRTIVEKDYQESVEKFDYDHEEKNIDDSVKELDWAQIKRLSNKKKKNIALSFDQDALKVLAAAYKIADDNHQARVSPTHLFCALIDISRVGTIFLRLGIPISQVRSKLQKVLSQEPELSSSDKLSMPIVSDATKQILFKSYEEAFKAHQEFVGVGELTVATVFESVALQEMLYDLDISQEKLSNVIEWVRIRERLRHNYLRFEKSARRRSKHGMDKAMTAIATPYLNRFAEDLTYMSQMGYLDVTVGRDDEIKEIFRVISAGGRNVLLVGDYGVGKMSVIEGIAEKMILGDVPFKLYDKRLVRLSVSALLAGTTPSGAIERLIRIMNEIQRAGNVILFIHNIHELIGVSAGGSEGEGMDVSETLVEHLNGGNFFTLATISSEGYSRKVVSSSMASAFAKVDINEMTETQAIQVLESKVGGVEYKHKVFFSYDALEKAVKLSARFIQDDYLPGSALEMMREAAAYARSKKGDNSLVSADDVATVISQKTKIPVNAVSSDESSKLLRLEEEMHKRVIGQSEAVNAVANALRRARAEMRSQNRPIANFLFLGPTGVGKTELAKTIAEIYFGGEQNVVRLDMSEYQDKASIYRLIGSPGEKGSGILTEAVRSKPFTLLLLDEIEKADPNVLNLFLQVMDDGRLTDSTGRTVDFTNVIIIATSNAGTAFVQTQINQGIPYDKILDQLLRGELAANFRPEFLNRFDGIILFRSLDRDSIKKIAGLMLKRVAKDLEKRGVGFEFGDGALEFLASVGYDPDFGARPMRRAIQEKIENKLAELILSGKLDRRDTIVVDADGDITVK